MRGTSDALVDATVKDVLPTGITLKNDLASPCTGAAGASEFSCTIPKSALEASDPAVEITFEAVVGVTAKDSGNRNVAIVTSNDDPSPCALGGVPTQTTVCDPEDLPESNNVDFADVDVKRLKELTAIGVCVGDLPYLDWSVKVVNKAPSTFTLQWATIEGTNVGDPIVLAVGDLTNNGGGVYSGRQLWYGASESPLDWPGWKLQDGIWVEDPTDPGGNLRPDALLKVTVNPTGQTTTFYPTRSDNTEDPCDPVNPTLTLVKNVVNDDGGSAKPVDFTLTATPQEGAAISGPGDPEATGGVLERQVPTGSFTLTEQDPPDTTCWVGSAPDCRSRTSA